MPFAIVAPPTLDLVTVNPYFGAWPFAHPSVLTIETWLKPAQGGMLTFSASTLGGSSLEIRQDGSVVPSFAGEERGRSGPTYLFDAAWHHLALTTDGSGGWNVYFDGASVAVQGTCPIALDNPASSLGGPPFLFGFGLRGYVARLLLWNVVRSQADIANGMTQLAAPATPGLVGRWNFVAGSNVDDTGTFRPFPNASPFETRDVPPFQI